MTRHLLSLLGAIALAAAIVVPVAAKVDHDPIYITLSGSTQALTANTSITSRKVTIQADPDNAAVVYVGKTSTMVGASTATYKLKPGMAVTLSPSKYEDERNQTFKLAEWAVRGTASDHVYVAYEVIR